MEISSEESSGEITAGQEMRRLKLDALEKGLHTDFSFLVGQDKRTALLIHCLKFDLLMASDYFGGLIRSGDPCPVHIRHIQPHIFKLLIRFVSVHNLDKMSCLEDAVLLARAADEFLLEPLQKFCALEIERMVTVENVWPTLNSISHIPKVAVACFKVLQYQTTKCLEDTSFTGASQRSLVFLLEMEPLEINSELDLLNASLKLAFSRPGKEGFELMRAALPHLRLLTLPMGQISPLTKYLLPPEKAILSGKLLFNEENSEPSPPSLNNNTNSRMRATLRQPHDAVQELIPEDLIITDHLKMAGQPLSKSLDNHCEVFSIDLIGVLQNVILTGIEILTRGNNHLEFKRRVQHSKRIEPVCVEYDEDLTLEVFSFVDGDKKATRYTKKIKGKRQFNSWFYFNFDRDVCLLQGTNYSIQVSVCPEGTKANYQIFPEDLIQETFAAAKCPIAAGLEVRNYFAHWKMTSGKESVSYLESNSTACIFKSLFVDYASS